MGNRRLKVSAPIFRPTAHTFTGVSRMNLVTVRGLNQRGRMSLLHQSELLTRAATQHVAAFGDSLFLANKALAI